jgi:hypothetical protein
LAWTNAIANRTGASRDLAPRRHPIPARLNLDLFQVGIAGEAANALGGERIPGVAERIDDDIIGVEQAVAEMPLA